MTVSLRCGCAFFLEKLAIIKCRLSLPESVARQLNIYNQEFCVKRIEDFYLEEVVIFQLQQHIMELGESDKILQEEKDVAEAAVEALKKKCSKTEKAIEIARRENDG